MSNGSEGSRNELKEKSTFKSLRLPENTVFNITSMMMNLEKNEEEVIKSYSCFYSPANEAFCLIIDGNTKYSELSRDILLNLMDFAKMSGIKNLIMLLDRKNKDYVSILQGMLMIGFQNDPKIKIAKLQDKEYKVLKMNLKAQDAEIEDIAF